MVRKVGRELAHELEHPADDQPKDVLRGMFLNAGMIAGKQRRVQDKEDKTGKADGLKDAEGFYDETLLVNHVGEPRSGLCKEVVPHAEGEAPDS